MVISLNKYGIYQIMKVLMSYIRLQIQGKMLFINLVIVILLSICGLSFTKKTVMVQRLIENNIFQKLIVHLIRVF